MFTKHYGSIFPLRHILVDYARQHKAEKRGGAEENLPLEEELFIVSEGKSAELLVKCLVNAPNLLNRFLFAKSGRSLTVGFWKKPTREAYKPQEVFASNRNSFITNSPSTRERWAKSSFAFFTVCKLKA